MAEFSLYSELNLGRTDITLPTLLGKRRAFENTTTFERIFLVVTVLSLSVSLGFTVYRISTLPPTSSDFTLALLLLLNIVFCYFYVSHGILYEQPYEILVLLVTTVVLLVYVILSFSEATQRDAVKTTRLVFSCVASPLVAVPALLLAWEYQASANLVFRTVGADPNMQSMCRKLQRAIVLLVFDAQALGSCLLLVLFGSVLTLEKIAVLVCGAIFTISWSTLGFVGMKFEKPVLIWVFLVLSPVHPSYVLWQIVATSLYQTNSLIEIVVYISGVLLLFIHIYLFVNTVQVYKNFGKGLRDRVYEVARTPPNKFLRSYGSMDSTEEERNQPPS